MLNKTSAYIAIIISMFVWSMSFIWTKELLAVGFSPIIIITLRLVISAVLLFLIFYTTKKIDRIDRKDYPLFLLLSFFEPFLYFFGENWGLKYVDASLGSIIIATIPIFVPIGLYFIHGEKMRWQIIIGVVLTFIGLFVMSYSGKENFNANLRGIALMFVAVIASVGYSATLYKVIEKYEPITITTTQNIIGAIYYLPIFFIFEWKTFLSLPFNFSTLYPLFALAILCSSIAFIFYSFSAKKLSVAKTTIFTNAIPIMTLLLVWVLGKEEMTINKVIGMLVVIVGVFLSQKDFKKKQII
ncbi:MAG: DMT family transporter [Bacteroidales bacterium]|jgi:drug/metabolite transporter (DMT)-like permease|nr:DMT family transporter [Bacteroidales bacterium]